MTTEKELNYFALYLPTVNIVGKKGSDVHKFVQNIGNDEYIERAMLEYEFNTSQSQFQLQELSGWFKQQQNYIMSLKYFDKLTLLSYTFTGDKIANSYLRGKLNIVELRQFLSEIIFEDTYIPIAHMVYEIIQDQPSDNIDSILVVDLVSVRDTQFLDYIYDAVHSRNNIITQNEVLKIYFSFYEEEEDMYINRIDKNFNEYEFMDKVLKTIFNSNNLMEKLISIILNDIYNYDFNYDTYQRICIILPYIDDENLKYAVYNYVSSLENIINNAPPLTRDLHVFRGIKSAFVPKTEGEYQSVDLISTSILFNKAIEFLDDNGCCLKHMVLQEGLRCIFLGDFSLVKNESEILIPPKVTFTIPTKMLTNIKYNFMKIKNDGKTCKLKRESKNIPTTYAIVN